MKQTKEIQAKLKADFAYLVKLQRTFILKHPKEKHQGLSPDLTLEENQLVIDGSLDEGNAYRFNFANLTLTQLYLKDNASYQEFAEYVEQFPTFDYFVNSDDNTYDSLIENYNYERGNEFEENRDDIEEEYREATSDLDDDERGDAEEGGQDRTNDFQRDYVKGNIEDGAYEGLDYSARQKYTMDDLYANAILFSAEYQYSLLKVDEVVYNFKAYCEVVDEIIPHFSADLAEIAASDDSAVETQIDLGIKALA